MLLPPEEGEQQRSIIVTPVNTINILFEFLFAIEQPGPYPSFFLPF